MRTDSFLICKYRDFNELNWPMVLGIVPFSSFEAIFLQNNDLETKKTVSYKSSSIEKFPIDGGIGPINGVNKVEKSLQ